MGFSLTRCPIGSSSSMKKKASNSSSRKHNNDNNNSNKPKAKPKKSRSINNNKVSVFRKDDGSSSPMPQRKKRRRSIVKLPLPPSSKINKYLELDRMEKEFLDENPSSTETETEEDDDNDNDDDNKNDEGDDDLSFKSDNEEKKRVPKANSNSKKKKNNQKPPIPSFEACSNLDSSSDEDDDDLLLFSSKTTNIFHKQRPVVVKMNKDNNNNKKEASSLEEDMKKKPNKKANLTKASKQKTKRKQPPPSPITTATEASPRNEESTSSSLLSSEQSKHKKASLLKEPPPPPINMSTATPSAVEPSNARLLETIPEEDEEVVVEADDDFVAVPFGDDDNHNNATETSSSSFDKASAAAATTTAAAPREEVTRNNIDILKDQEEELSSKATVSKYSPKEQTKDDIADATTTDDKTEKKKNTNKDIEQSGKKKTKTSTTNKDSTSAAAATTAMKPPPSSFASTVALSRKTNKEDGNNNNDDHIVDATTADDATTANDKVETKTRTNHDGESRQNEKLKFSATKRDSSSTTSTATTTTTKNPSSVSRKKSNGPNGEDDNDGDILLFKEVDRLYLASDENDLSIKGFYKLLEKQTGGKMDKATKRKVRSRLTELVNGNIQATTSSSTAAATFENDASAVGPSETRKGSSNNAVSDSRNQINDKMCVGDSAVVPKETALDHAKTGPSTNENNVTAESMLHGRNALADGGPSKMPDKESISHKDGARSVSSAAEPTTTTTDQDGTSVQLSQNTSLALDAMLLLAGSPELKGPTRPTDNNRRRANPAGTTASTKLNDDKSTLPFEENVTAGAVADATSTFKATKSEVTTENVCNIESASGRMEGDDDGQRAKSSVPPPPAKGKKKQNSGEKTAVAKKRSNRCWQLIEEPPRIHDTQPASGRMKGDNSNQKQQSSIPPPKGKSKKMKHLLNCEAKTVEVKNNNNRCWQLIEEPPIIRIAANRKNQESGDDDSNKENAASKKNSVDSVDERPSSDVPPEEPRKTKTGKQKKKTNNNAAKEGTASKLSAYSSMPSNDDILKPPSDVPLKEPAKTKTKRKRQKKETTYDSAKDTATADDPSTGNQTTARPRKRARKKGACALCITCPCQKSHNVSDSNVSSLDMKAFARSATAVEKALIRRVQKLEKSAEYLEEQSELVKRKLKTHRREIQRKKQKKLEVKRDRQSRFLPDPVDFEAYQGECSILPQDTVQEAVKRTFSITKEGMPTLSQLWGTRTKKNESDPIKNTEETLQEEEEEADKAAAEQRVVKEFNGDVTIPMADLIEGRGYQSDEYAEENPEYVREPEYVEVHDCIEWKDDEKTTGNNSNGMRPKSIWGAMRLIPEGVDSITRLPLNCTQSNWDAMFAESSSGVQDSDGNDDDEGLDHLFGLFEESPVLGSQGKIQTTVSSPAPDQGIRMSMLSQDAQNVASRFCVDIASSKDKSTQLKRACPNWKENIAFAFFQKDRDELTEALENVRTSRKRMIEKKRKLLEAWERQDLTLEVFESALSTSLDHSIRSAENEVEPSSTCQGEVFDGGYLTAPMSQAREAEEEEKEAIKSVGKVGNGNVCTSPSGQCRMEHEDEKKEFLMFTRVLLKYIGQKDPTMHQEAKMLIKDCSERNKRQDVGFESVVVSMKERLKDLVGDQIWNRAKIYLEELSEKKSGES